VLRSDLGPCYDARTLILSTTKRKIDVLATEILIVLGEYLFAEELLSSDIDYRTTMEAREAWSCTRDQEVLKRV
jgi:hypothetical protein